MLASFDARRFRQEIVALLVGILCVAMVSRVEGQGRGQGGRGGSMRVFLGLGPEPDPEAAKRGEPLYQRYCVTCHGEQGRGAQAPSLIRSVVVLHDEKGETLAPVLRDGRPGMPGLPALTNDDIFNLSQYLHLQVELTANRGTYDDTYASLRREPSGDRARGEAFFTGAGGCTACHSATGDLAKIGAKFPQAAALKARFLWPAASGPAKATVITPAGRRITGSVRMLTDFDISLVDETGAYHYWRRPAVKVEIEDRLAGHRSLLPKYSDADINNLAAYLGTLR
jgi:mono/diheme cytochrome c family protein